MNEIDIGENLIDNVRHICYIVKLDENGIITRNKARLVARGYNKDEGINYEETYVFVAHLEAIRLLLASPTAWTLSFTRWTLSLLFLMTI